MTRAEVDAVVAKNSPPLKRAAFAQASPRHGRQPALHRLAGRQDLHPALRHGPAMEYRVDDAQACSGAIPAAPGPRRATRPGSRPPG